MRKLLLFLVCSVFTMTAWAADNNQSRDLTTTENLGENTAVWQILENLNESEKANAIIEIECETEQEAIADPIEEEWNGGNCEEAIEMLKDSPELGNSAIGIQWKEPVTSSKMRWSGDVQIGSRDTIQVVALDVDNKSGNLFAVLNYYIGGNSYWCVNISSDTGKTWAETFNLGSMILDIDAKVLRKYLYVAYSVTSGTGRMRRFNVSDGSSDNVYGYHTIINETITGNVTDVALTTTEDNNYWDTGYLLYFAIMDNDSLRLYWDDTLATSWSKFDPDIGNAERGLDACCSFYPDSSNKMWASYIGTDDNLHLISGWGSWTDHGAIDYAGTSTDIATSISGWGDTVITTFSQYNSDSANYEARYRISYHGETGPWLYGVLASSSTPGIGYFVSDVTARNGDGIAVVYADARFNAEASFRHRTCNTPLWSDPYVFSDSVPRYNVRPSIERISENYYGIVYVTYPEQIALFDISDNVSGIEEKETATSNGKIECGLDQNIITGTALLSYTLPEQAKVDVSLVNILGQKIATLESGEKAAGTHSLSVSAEKLSQGVYYIVVETEEGLKGVSKATVLK